MSEIDGRPIRVLLADDHRMLREALRHSLEEHGFDVVGEAGDGEEAVTLAGEFRPDVVLMDVTMPVMGGIDATRRLRERHPDVRVVILTMHNISLKPKNPAKAAGGIKANTPLELAGTVKTYRYLDAEEAAAQEKADAGSAGKKGH